LPGAPGPPLGYSSAGTELHHCRVRMTSPAIRTDQLTRDFGALRALDALSLEVPSGTVFGFLGPNGSGKTTAIRLLLGLLDPTAGRAEVLGFDTRTAAGEIRERTGALLEHAGLYERLSAEANLDFFGRIWRMNAGDRAARIRELLGHFGLWERRRDPAGTWSRGMKQKLAIARSLLHRPTLVFLDEPTAGLDPVAAVSLRSDITALAEREGTTVFVTTHNLAEAEKMCGLVGVVSRGRLLGVGTPEQLRTANGRPTVEIVGGGWDRATIATLESRFEVAALEVGESELRIELASGASAAPLVRILVEGGAQIEEVRRGRGTLEEAFLALVEGAA
jgi:ABC-2 type transport system ATP-binding protein